MFIQTESTPNPLTLKFVPGRVLSLDGNHTFTLGEPVSASPLAARLFLIEGVVGVFISQDFLSVTKSADASWDVLKPLLLGALMDHLVAELPIIVTLDGKADHAAASTAALDPISQQIQGLLDTRIRPAVSMDGGDIVFHKFEDGVVYLQLHGACSGCPSSSLTLKSGIENMLKHYVPEVLEVRAIE